MLGSIIHKSSLGSAYGLVKRRFGSNGVAVNAVSEAVTEF
jgi:hypothetical protein